MVDYEESILKSKIKNPDLEIGISLDEKESPQGKMIYVHWFSEQKGGWAPVSSLRILQNYVKNN